MIKEYIKHCFKLLTFARVLAGILMIIALVGAWHLMGWKLFVGLNLLWTGKNISEWISLDIIEKGARK